MLNRVYIIIFSTIVLSTNIYSQQILSLDDCRNRAIENSKTLKIASEEVRAAHYNKKEALSKFFPEISFMGGYIHNQKNLHLIPSSAIPQSIDLPNLSIPVPEELRQQILGMGEIDIKNIWAGGFTLMQPLFMGGKIVNYNDLRRYAEELSETMQDKKMTDVIVEVDNVYWQVVSLTNKKKLADSYVGLLKKLDADIQAMEEEGVATKADRLSVSVKLNEAEMTQTKAENGVSLSKMLLCQICGIAITDQIVLKDENIASVDVEKNSIPLFNIDEALANRKEIKSLELATKIYEKKEAITKSEFMPQVALTANYLWTNPNLDDGFEKKFSGMWNVGVMAKVPLNFFSNSSKLNAARAETRIKRYELDEAKEKITLEVNQSAYKLSEADKKLTASRKNSEKANENLRYANVGFEEGVIPASDVMAAHTAWMAANSELIDAQIDVKLCHIYLNKALGRNIITTNQVR